MSIAGVKDVYLCDGTRTDFAITFPFTSPREVSVFIENTDTGERRRMVRNLDYVIVGSTLKLRDDDFRDPWPVGWNICIESRVRVEQGSSQAMTPATFAKRVNQLTQVMQQIREQTLRTLHVGQDYPPLNLTSKLYAYEFFDSAIGVGGFADSGHIHPTAAFADSVGGIGGFMVSGTMREPVITYEDWPADVSTGVGASMVEGTMREPIVTYSDWPVDAAIGLGANMVEGTMIAPIVTYTDWPVDPVIGLGAVLVEGTLN